MAKSERPARNLDEAPPRPFPPPSQLDHEVLKAFLDYYRFLISYFSAVDPKKNKRLEGDNLLAQDDFRHMTLPNRVAQRCNKIGPIKAGVIKPLEEMVSTHGWINLEELERLMEWKLRRGRNRPGLQSLVGSNTDEEVVQITRKVFGNFGLAKKEGKKPAKEYKQAAMKDLCTLNGVGPATSSLILSVAFPSDVPYFSDELYFWCVNFSGISQGEFTRELHQRFEDVVIDKKKPKVGLKYTMKEYDVLWDKVVETGLTARADPKSQDITAVSATDLEKAAFVIMRADEASTALGWTHAKPEGLYEDFVRDHMNASPEAPEEPEGKRKRTSTIDEQKGGEESASSAPKRTIRKSSKKADQETPHKSPVYAPRRAPRRKAKKSVTPMQPLTPADGNKRVVKSKSEEEEKGDILKTTD